MRTGLHLTTEEFDRMVACGAFDHLHRKIAFLSPLVCTEARLDVGDLFISE